MAVTLLAVGSARSVSLLEPEFPYPPNGYKESHRITRSFVRVCIATRAASVVPSISFFVYVWSLLLDWELLLGQEGKTACLCL